MKRRDILTLLAASVLPLSVGRDFGRGLAQALVPVRLLLLRRNGLSPTNQCKSPCIRGRLFDVSDLGANPLDQTLIPLLETRMAVCDVIERPWQNNAPHVSSIPKGQYVASIRDDASKPWMNTLDKRWRLELKDAPHRSAIQFHFGSDVSWSEGCFIVGSLRQLNDQQGISAAYCRLDDGEKAVAHLRAAVTSPGRNSRDIRIGVADHGGLFPDFTAQSPC